MKLCKDCDHYRSFYGNLSTFKMCHHPDNAKLDPVSGNPAILCSINRTIQGVCGHAGDLWEPIKPKSKPKQNWWQQFLFGERF